MPEMEFFPQRPDTSPKIYAYAVLYQAQSDCMPFFDIEQHRIPKGLYQGWLYHPRC